MEYKPSFKQTFKFSACHTHAANINETIMGRKLPKVLMLSVRGDGHRFIDRTYKGIASGKKDATPFYQMNGGL